MREGLKIYACSGLNLSEGVGTAKEDFNYWLDNTETIHNTCAVNSLLADINLLFAQLQYDNTMTDEEVLNALNLIDLYVVCLQVAQEYRNNHAELKRAGSVIARMVAENEFAYNSLDNAERDEHLDELIATADGLILSGEEYKDMDSTFMSWYNENVIKLNYEGYDKQTQQRAEDFLNSQQSVGATKADASKYITDSGSYYLYLYMTDSAAKQTTKNIQWKRKQQQGVYDYSMKAFAPLYGSKDAVNKVLYTGFMKQYKATPEAIVNGFTNKGGKDGIGEAIIWTAAAVASIVSAVLSFLAGVISAILTYCAKVVEAKYSDPVNAEYAIADGADIEELDDRMNSETSDKSKLLKYGIIAAIALFFLKK